MSQSVCIMNADVCIRVCLCVHVCDCMCTRTCVEICAGVRGCMHEYIYRPSVCVLVLVTFFAGACIH